MNGIPPLPPGYRLGNLSNVRDYAAYRLMLEVAVRDVEGIDESLRLNRLAKFKNYRRRLQIQPSTRIIFALNPISQQPTGMVQARKLDNFVVADYVSVLPAYRYKHVGRGLLEMLEARAVQTNHSALVLTSAKGKVDWYGRRGFEEATLDSLQRLMSQRNAQVLLNNKNKGLVPMVKWLQQYFNWMN
jgi:GNAT superfamily N-acetyltransferase